MFIHTHVRYFIFLFFQFKLGWGFLQVQIWGAGVVKICTEKHVHVYIYIQYNGFVLFWFQSGWGFYCTQIWGYVAGGDKICSCEFFILNILRNMVGRQKYKIQKCMINPNDLIIQKFRANFKYRNVWLILMIYEFKNWNCKTNYNHDKISQIFWDNNVGHYGKMNLDF